MSKVFKAADRVYIHTTASHIGEAQAGGTPPLVPAELGGAQIRHLSGFSVGRQGYFESDLSTTLTFGGVTAGDLADSLGEWSAIAESSVASSRTYLVFADSYGYCPVFYTLVEGQGMIIADSYAGAVAGLEQHGVSRSLNISNYAMTLASGATQFNNPTVEQTMSEQIRILPLDKVLIVAEGSVWMVKRSEVFPELNDMSYEELVGRGRDLAGEALTALGELPFASRGLLLSGGVDSRLVLSFILSAGLKEKFSIRTSDPRDYKSAYSRRVFERDAQIAVELQQHFGLKWMDKGQAESISVSFREALAFHQSHSSNFSFALRLPQALSIQGAPLVTLRGGGGEILRSTGTGWNINKWAEERPELEGKDAVAKISAWYMSKSNRSNPFDPQIIESVAELIGGLPGNTAVEKLNEHYLRTRNRTHFGHGRSSKSVNELPVQLLSNIYFLEASRKIGFEERAHGKLVQDIFRTSFPELLQFPFESLEWHGRLVAEGVSSVPKSENAWMKVFDALKSKRPRPQPRAGWERGSRGESPLSNVNHSARTYVGTAFRFLEETSGGEELKDLHGVIEGALDDKSLDLMGVTAKVASAMDTFYPEVGEGSESQLHTRAATARSSFTAAVVNWPSLPGDGWNNIPLPEIKPTLTLAGGALRVAANPVAGTGQGLEFAFYLLKEGKKVDQQWYSPSDTCRFTPEPGNGSYEVRVYVKVPRVRRAVVIEKTPPVQVGG